MAIYANNVLSHVLSQLFLITAVWSRYYFTILLLKKPKFMEVNNGLTSIHLLADSREYNLGNTYVRERMWKWGGT